MKTITLSLMLFCFSLFSVAAENYYVVKVVGKIFMNNAELKTGDKLSDENIIKFTAAQDKIYLLSPSKGYFLLSPAEHEKNSKEWLVALKHAIVPKNKYYNTANRGSSGNFSTFDDIYDLKGFFRKDVLVIEKSIFFYNSDKIPLDKNNYFEFESLTNKNKINFYSDKNSFSISGNFNIDDFKMIYFHDGEKKEIGTFTLKIEAREKIANELAVLFSNQNKNNTTIIYYEQVIPYISEAYGNTNIEVVKDIIINDLKIPLKVKD